MAISEVKLMNIGEKINLLFERSGFKNYADWGKAMGISGDWLLELRKKDTIKTVDISRLIIIVDYNNITLDELLKDDDGNYIIDIKNDLPENDIGKMIDNIQEQLKSNEIKFYGYSMNKECIMLALDGLDILKGIIKANL
jgi:hypothetical protein